MQRRQQDNDNDDDDDNNDHDYDIDQETTTTTTPTTTTETSVHVMSLNTKYLVVKMGSFSFKVKMHQNRFRPGLRPGLTTRSVAVVETGLNSVRPLVASYTDAESRGGIHDWQTADVKFSALRRCFRNTFMFQRLQFL